MKQKEFCANPNCFHHLLPIMNGVEDHYHEDEDGVHYTRGGVLKRHRYTVTEKQTITSTIKSYCGIFQIKNTEDVTETKDVWICDQCHDTYNFFNRIGLRKDDCHE